MFKYWLSINQYLKKSFLNFKTLYKMWEKLTQTGHVVLGNERIAQVRFFCHARHKVPIGDAILEQWAKVARD